MSILSGFKRYKDYLKTDSGYILTSRWTKANSVEMNDGSTLEEKVAELKGSITSAAAGAATVKYDNSESDYIQVLVDGEWKQTKLDAGLIKLQLFSANSNTAGFEASAHRCSTINNGDSERLPSVSVGENLKIVIDDWVKGVHVANEGSVISKKIDLTTYSKLVFTHQTYTTVEGQDGYKEPSGKRAGIAIMPTLIDMYEPTMFAEFFNYSLYAENPKAETVEIDVSNLSGEYYIAIALSNLCNHNHSYDSRNYLTVEISDMYLD